MAGTIFMTIAISIERYLGLCHPLLSPHSRKAWFYIVPVVFVAFALNVPKFLEIKLDLNEVIVDNITNATITRPSLSVNKLRTSSSYIKGYQMWTRLFTTGIIPLKLLFFLNILIIRDILTSSKKTQR